MKIGYKILVTFMGVLTVSVTIFLMVCYYILNAGCYSGISRNDMKSAVSYGEKIFLEEKDDMTTLEKLENEYENMDFAILDNGAWKSLENLPVLADEKDILDAMNENLDSCEDYKVLAGAVEYGEKSIYISCFVEKTDFESMSYEFNMTRNKGILGKLAVIGVLITIILLIPALYMLQQDYNKKEKENMQKKELISNLSHDLRTPLSSVIGYSEMHKNGIYDNENDKNTYIDIIYRKALYMEKLLAELLEYSRLELGTIHLNKEKMDITELIREILIEYYPEIEKNEYILELEISEKPIIGVWDKEKLGRVIRNLMDNALKYGMDGKKLRISVKEEDDNACVEIEDFGKGIPKSDISHVAEKFYRADSARNSQKGGMGLGLFIVQEIIKLHNGTFRIISDIGQGCKMCIKLPIYMH